MPDSSRLKGLRGELVDHLVYLVGSPRGGTTVIANSLYLSEEVFSFPRMTRFSANVWQHRKTVPPTVLRHLFRMPRFYREDLVLKSLGATERACLAKRITEAFASRDLGRIFQLYPIVYALDPECAKDPARAVCWADKSNDVYGLSDIRRSLPQAKFILIVRDPRATIASMQTQMLSAPGASLAEGKAARALMMSSIYWRNMMQRFLFFARRHPDCCTFIKYEDFLNAPEQTVNQLLEFVGAQPLDNPRLQAGLSTLTQKRQTDGAQVGFGIDRRPLDRWRQTLRPDELELIAALTWRTAQKLGYEVEPPKRRFRVARPLADLGGLTRGPTLLAKLAYLKMAEVFVPSLRMLGGYHPPRQVHAAPAGATFISNISGTSKRRAS